jgi:peptide/nickel transport system permease protein
MGGALVAISRPSYFLGLVVLYLFADDIGSPDLPGAGSYVPFSEDPSQWFTSLIMPWFVLAAAFAAFYARLLRGNLIDTMHEDYIRTARAKGLARAAGDLPPRRARGDHADRHPARPGHRHPARRRHPHRDRVQHPRASGATRSMPISQSDLPVIQGTVLFGAFFIVMMS